MRWGQQWRGCISSQGMQNACYTMPQRQMLKKQELKTGLQTGKSVCNAAVTLFAGCARAVGKALLYMSKLHGQSPNVPYT